MNDPIHPPLKVARLQRLGRYLTVALVAFMAGFLPTWLTARARATERDAAHHARDLAQTENTLAAAVIHARRGDYEVARTNASAFYTSLRAGLDRPDTTFTAAQLARLQPLLADRDEIITLLARGDQAAAERLAEVYLAYRQTTPAATDVAR